MIPAFRNAKDPTARAIEFIRLLMLLLILVGWVLYPVELIILQHWLDSPESRIPFLISIPALISTVLILFDRKTPWIRWFFIVSMWISVLTGIIGAYYHWVWNFEGEINWEFSAAMEALAGSRPVLVALVFTHMGVTGLLAVYRTGKEVQGD